MVVEISSIILERKTHILSKKNILCTSYAHNKLKPPPINRNKSQISRDINKSAPINLLISFDINDIFVKTMRIDIFYFIPCFVALSIIMISSKNSANNQAYITYMIHLRYNVTYVT